jgi:hypothetical protein
MSRLLLRYTLIAGLALAGPALNGCTALGGRQVRIQEGVTTEGELLRWLGVPDAKTLEPDGRRVVVYDYHRLTDRSTPWVAFLGFIHRVFGAEGQTLHLTVGPDGVVEWLDVQPAGGRLLDSPAVGGVARDVAQKVRSHGAPQARTPPAWPWTVTSLTKEP